MDKRDGIEDLFRNSAADFQPEPRASTWDRLEQRLGEEAKQSPAQVFSLYRVVAVAASLLVLAVCGIVVSWYLSGRMTDSRASVVEISDLSTDADGPHARFLTLQPELDYKSIHIREGASSSRLIAKNSKPFFPEDRALAQAEPPLLKEEGNQGEVGAAQTDPIAAAIEPRRPIGAPVIEKSTSAAPTLTPRSKDVLTLETESDEEALALTEVQISSYGMPPMEEVKERSARGAAVNKKLYQVDGVPLKDNLAKESADMPLDSEADKKMLAISGAWNMLNTQASRFSGTMKSVPVEWMASADVLELRFDGQSFSFPRLGAHALSGADDLSIQMGGEPRQGFFQLESFKKEAFPAALQPFVQSTDGVFMLQFSQ